MRAGFLPIQNGAYCCSIAATVAAVWKMLLAEPMPYRPGSLVRTLRNTQRYAGPGARGDGLHAGDFELGQGADRAGIARGGCRQKWDL
jgi:hypothetical protein